jgi:hypothetical protein
MNRWSLAIASESQTSRRARELQHAYDAGGQLARIVTCCVLVIIVAIVVLITQRTALRALLARARGREVESPPVGAKVAVLTAIIALPSALLVGFGAVAWTSRVISRPTTDILSPEDLRIDQITNEVPRLKAGVLGCYSRGVERNQALRGRFVAVFTVDPDGRVSHAGLEASDLGDAEVEQCVRSVFKNARFSPGSGDEVTVRYPIELSR